jgi:hypothetical protein
MNHEDAMRRIHALRNVTLSSGAFPAEVDTARRLSKRIAERFAIDPEERQPQPGADSLGARETYPAVSASGL